MFVLFSLVPLTSRGKPLMTSCLIAYKINNQSSKRPVRSESLELGRIFVKQEKNIVIFSLGSQMTGLIQNEQNIVISKHFTKPEECTRTTSGTIFKAEIWIRDG